VRHFDIDPFKKYRLLRGLDDISMTLEYEPDIAAYEEQRDDAALPSTAR
jgi:3-isopropylmalate/(R)-2-methylmalate dehydratase small subunit